MSSQTLLTRKDTDVGEGVFDSIAWAFEVHVKQSDSGRFQVAILYGNEDAPEKIEFFNPDPTVSEVPVYTWEPKKEN